MIKEKISFETLNITIKYNEGYEDYIFVYIHSKEFALNVLGNYCFIFINNNHWEKDFTPFKHSSVFKGGNEFLGGAYDYLLKFKEFVLFVEENLNLKIKYRILAGYSLAGLFALFATSKLEFFTKICCCSASFWYPGFLDYVKNNEFSFKEAYFSIGDKESKTKNQFLSKAYDSMIEIKEIFENKGKTIIFELNEGGHFNNAEKRMVKGITYLLNDI